MSRHIHAPDRGASLLEYAAVLVLVAAVAATLLTVLTGQSSAITTGIQGAIERILGGQGEVTSADGGDGAGAPDGGTWPTGDDGGNEGGAPTDGTTGDPGEEENGAGGGEPAGDSGAGPATGGEAAGDQGGGLWNLAWEFGIDGVGGGITDDVTEWWHTLTDPVGAVVDTWDGLADYYTQGQQRIQEAAQQSHQQWAEGDYWGAIWTGVEAVGREQIWESPWGPGGLYRSIIDEGVTQAGNNGDYAEAVGRTVWNAGQWFIPGAGWANRFQRALPDAPSNTNRADGNNQPSQNQADGIPQQNRRDDNDDSNSNRADGACPVRNSFLPGTPVLLADGTYTLIETIETGDEVWAFDPLTGDEGPRAVTHLIEGDGEKTLVEITITDTNGATDTLTATDGHPFWAPELAQWIDAIDLTPGTWLRTSAGTWAQVTAIDTWSATNQQVHNLTIDEIHTYYVGVGPTAILVHNAPGGCPEGRAPEDPNIGADNYRGRYQAWLARNGYERLPRDWDAHHAIPQEYRNHPEFQDFDFDAPSNLRGVPGSRFENRATNIHQNITDEWRWFRERNPNATRAEIEEFAENIDARYDDYYWRETEPVD